MYLSELEGKEIINLYDGTRLGTLGNAEVVFEPETGIIKALLLPGFQGFLKFQNKEDITIPWESIRKVGTDMMLVDLHSQKLRSRNGRNQV
ncbi:YlmC/YmxH family sporulation protein [Candidatus Contubernalis alkaliaceticus]|uniref:YlmC/YmxH family sporulation protein n=1 Tax=Candidatus Contubernalis alkaliaceticus TaxID=338645 RepID=UPI001F4C2D6E|nr:YlmC/YmxH family sporulation protein [Candidatus Contubernalis alkalaceticus]UNC91849.1 YlmC/YmxH family sporulation protein [Candidatus Contubernalis alkalaceticus]